MTTIEKSSGKWIKKVHKDFHLVTYINLQKVKNNINSSFNTHLYHMIDL